MQTAQLNLSTVVLPDGTIDVAALPLLRDVVERYPYYHAARMLLLRLLYQLRDSEFNEELRHASLYLPSRARIYQEIEGDSMRPTPREESPTGATHARKSRNPLELRSSRKEDRTGALIDTFLQTTSPILLDSRSGRPVDATTDYMAYFMQEEASKALAEAAPGDDIPAEEAPSAENVGAATKDQSLVDIFISTQGEGRIRLTEKKDSELQKPSLPESENGSGQGALTETLARIYIKQGKFEQAIKIIRQLSLKYPKKNRYFADQIRFLEKLILNQQGK